MAGKRPLTRSDEEANERLLVIAAQADPDKFADLYEINFERVYAFIARRVHNREEVEDLASEVFRKALANLTRYKSRGAPFAAWLFRIAANLIADRAKSSSREQELDVIDEPVNSGDQQLVLEAVECQARLFRSVRQLPADQQRVIEMRFAEEQSIREIAQELGRTEGAVKQLQFRGLQNLRSSLSESDGE